MAKEQEGIQELEKEEIEDGATEELGALQAEAMSESTGEPGQQQQLGEQGKLQTQEPEVDPEIERRARLQGWVPKKEFKGDPLNWRPASEFVKRADEMMPILKSVNKKLEGQIEELTTKLTETQKTMERMVKIQTKYSDDFYGTKISDIKAQKLKAVQDGDIETYKRLDEQESKISKPEPIEIKETPDQTTIDGVHPDVKRWMDENRSWFGKDAEMTDYATFIGEQLKNAKHYLATPGNEYAFCEEVKQRVQNVFPSKFHNPNQQRSDIDEPNIRGGDINVDSNKKGWNDLPAEAKTQCMRLIGEVPGYTKERYIRDYFEGA